MSNEPTDPPAQVSDAARLRVARSLLRHRDALMTHAVNATALCHDLQTAATMLAPPMVMPAEASGKSGPSLWLLHELRTYLDAQVITGESIGDIRRACFLPWDSAWNGLVRDETATREQRSVSVGAAVPPAPTSTPGPQARAGARHVSDLTRSELVRGLAECIARVENAARTASRTDFVRAYVSEVDGLLVAARAARVALDMPLQPSIDAVVRQILCEFVGFFSGDVPELHGVEVPRLAESLDRFLRALAKDAL